MADDWQGQVFDFMDVRESLLEDLAEIGSTDRARGHLPAEAESVLVLAWH